MEPKRSKLRRLQTKLGIFLRFIVLSNRYMKRMPLGDGCPWQSQKRQLRFIEIMDSSVVLKTMESGEQKSHGDQCHHTMNCETCTESGQKVFVKVFSDDRSIDFFRECEAYERLKHLKEHVCPILHMKQNETESYITMKRYDCDLFTYVCEGPPLQTKIIRELFKKICNAVHTIHKNGVAHLDLKPENVLIDIVSQQVVLCDFGLSLIVPKRYIYFRTQYVNTGHRGTTHYCAPEILANKPFNPFSADVFSLGVTLFVLLTGFFPQRDPATARIILEGHLTKVLPSQLLNCMLHCDPSLRYTMKQVLYHPWVAES